MSLITGPLIGGFLIAHFGWHSIFLINLPVGLITLILGIISIPESADPAHTSLDPVGQVLSVLGLAGLSYGLIRGGDIGWSDPVTLGLLGAPCCCSGSSSLPNVESRHRCCRSSCSASLLSGPASSAPS
ncbi:MFS transporter [Rhizorhabdus histidinilytica]